MDDSGTRPVIVWGITDGRAGHRSQLQGLSSALAQRCHSEYHERAAPPLSRTLVELALGRARFAAGLPDPDIIIGAGHATHPAVLCAQHARGGTTVILMQPSLPLRWFDLCIIPEHDEVAPGKRVMLSRGPLNNVKPAGKRNNHGIIMVGGPSRHYRWDEEMVLRQIAAIIKSDPRPWILADSPRTPETMRTALARQAGEDTDYLFWEKTPASWLRDRLGECHTAWVSEDSMSMIYEALTGGARTGLLNLAPRRNSRIVRGINSLVREGDVTRFHDWRGGPLPLPRRTYDEASRCAGELINRFLPAVRP